MILRLPAQVKLFNEKDEVVLVINSTKKSQIRLRVHGLPRDKWQYGTCRVWYNRPNDYWNEFGFTSLAQLEAGLVTVTEKPLIDFMEGIIPREYLEKRKMSAAQARAILQARKNSKLGVSA
jgi:hypothetical protein